jgi:caffeoyl-CoA O-methyltransferase
LIVNSLQIVCLELEPYLKDFAAPFFEKAGQQHKLEVRIGDAIESIKQLSAEGHTFDIVFLDANKTGYLDYYNLVMDNCMVTPAGFVVVDNTLMKVRIHGHGLLPCHRSRASRLRQL